MSLKSLNKDHFQYLRLRGGKPEYFQVNAVEKIILYNPGFKNILNSFFLTFQALPLRGSYLQMFEIIITPVSGNSKNKGTGFFQTCLFKTLSLPPEDSYGILGYIFSLTLIFKDIQTIIFQTWIK
ncbi:hypothetical protein UNH65_17260 [Chitinophaga sp. 180180018-2]|nr:hypothetical protein [Chitinophaga sp. 212800010-3]